MDAENVQRQINETVRFASNEMLSNISELLDKRLADMQRNISENQKAIAEKQEARMEQVISEGYKFKKRGNEEQHKHNVKVFAKMQEANENLKENKVQSAQRNIAEGLDIIKNRQKLIKLADSSEAGWRAVDEYTKNPIASDSEDEKKISKAQTRADRKVKEAKAKKRKDFRDSARPYQKPSWSQTSADNTTWKSGHCYRCNKRGHWRKDCTEKLNGDKE
nr:uncharacterized protein LOC117685658 [Crassostrea gigas]